MDPRYAAAIIRLVMANKMKEQSIADGHGTIWRKLHGQTRKDLMKKRVVVSNSNTGMVPAKGPWKEPAFVCFWVVLDSPITSTDILIQEASGIATTFFGAMMFTGTSMPAGKAMDTAYEIKGNIEDTLDFVQKAHTAVSGVESIATGLNTAWRAGMSGSVLGTSNEFGYYVRQGLSCGCAAISGPLDKWKIKMKIFNDDVAAMMSFMAAAERIGNNTLAAREYIRGLCDNGGVDWSYNTSMPKS